MVRSLPIIEARNRLTKLPEELARNPKRGAIAVTRRGKPVLALLSWDLYESIIETMEILGDPEMMAAFRQGVKEIEEGKVIPWEQAKKDLGW
jgi:prevent-host-death family protein